MVNAVDTVAIYGDRELASSILVMSTTLVAMFVPIGFMGGLAGSFFAEFAFTLVATAVISMIVALTLTPMLSSKVRKPTPTMGLSHRIDQGFIRSRGLYNRSLHMVMGRRPMVLVAGARVLINIPFLFFGSNSELAPAEDQGVVLVSGTGSATATLEYLNKYGEYGEQIHKILSSFPETVLVWQISDQPPSGGAGNNVVFGGSNLKPWADRSHTEMQILPQVQKKLDAVTGLQTIVFTLPVVPGSSGGLPIQFALTSTHDFAQMNAAAGQLIGAAMKTGEYAFLTKDMRYDVPTISLDVKRDVAANLGLDMSDIGQNLSALLSENFVSRLDMSGHSYEVIPQASDSLGADASALSSYYLRSSSNKFVPLTTVVDVKRQVRLEFLPQFRQQNSVTIKGTMAPGIILDQALTTLKNLAQSSLPAGYAINYASLSRPFIQQGHAIVTTFALSILLVYLLIAAQFESFRDPLIVLVAVPMSAFVALVFLFFGAATPNIYTEVGLIALIDLITKQSILVVQFANVIRKPFPRLSRSAVAEKTSIRLRPVLMTTAAMILGVVPLLLATGPGAVSRFTIGLVVAAGFTVGALISLYVVPVVYTYIAVDKITTIPGAVDAGPDRSSRPDYG